MKKLFFLFFVISVAIVTMASTSSTSEAKPGKRGQTNHNVLQIPSYAVEVVPNMVYWLGTAVEKGRLVEGYAIIHREKGFGKPAGCNDDGKCQGWEDANCGDCNTSEPPVTDSTCYGFLTKGAKWKEVENYMIDYDSIPTSLLKSFVSENIALNIAKWEDAADGTTNGIIIDILGDEVSGAVNGADTFAPDNKNEVLFGYIDDPGVIAVTIVWGIFSGPPPLRELVEWDQVYNDTDFSWSVCTDQNCTDMDFESISTHELGHTFGLDDLYTDSCSEETMYGYASEGEIAKRTLELGDITGIYQLYK
jgi:hypothetical protein